MKLKCRPDDFVVTELISRSPVAGSFALFQLAKTDIGTHEAMRQIQRAWNLPTGRIQHAGLKDRHAQTTQWITIRSGPRADLSLPNIDLTYAGQTDRPIEAQDIDGNRFDIVVRSLSSQGADGLCDAAESLKEHFVPNFFDRQRFGSLGASGEFVAAACCRRDFERATWLALADPNRHDHSDEKQQKSLLRDHWQDWATCKERLSRSNRRSVITYLVDHPEGFRKAFGLIRPELRGLFLSALQSAVWNRMLAACVDRHCPVTHSARIADLDVPLKLLPNDNEQIPVALPLPSARCRSLSAAVQRLADSAASAYELSLSDMKMIYPRDRFFSRGDRDCRLRPTDVSCEVIDDELYPGHRAVRLSFQLPRGCYATMIIRTLTAGMSGQENNA